MTDTDSRTPLGVVRLDYLSDGPQPLGRVFDCLDVPLMLIGPAGVRDLEKLTAAYWTSLARWRATNLDLEDWRIDLDDCRETLATLPRVGDPANFGSIDWHEVGKRLENLRPFGGYGELSRLHALLTCDDPEVFRG